MREATLLGAVFLGCVSARPASIEDWKACLFAASSLRFPQAGSTEGTMAGPSAGRSVLLVHARWGESPFRSEYAAGELMVELRGDLRPGATWSVGPGVPAVYAEGSQGLTYAARWISGSVRVDAVEDGVARLSLDLQATPSTDITKRGRQRFRGAIQARWRARTEQCD